MKGNIIEINPNDLLNSISANTAPNNPSKLYVVSAFAWIS